MLTVLLPLQQAADAAPGAPAAFTADATVDYATLAGSVERAVGGLLESGFGEGSRIGLLMDNSLAHLTLGYAIPGAGAVLVDIDGTHPAAQVEAVVRDADLEAVVIDANHLTLAHELTRGGVAVPILDHRQLENGSPRSIRHDEDAPAVITYSAATRPAQRGRTLSHRNLLDASRHARARLAMQADDRYLHVMPMATTGDLILGLAVTAVGAGHSFGRAMSLEVLRAAAEGQRISLTLVGPGMIGALRVDPQTYGADLTSLRAVVSSDSDVQPDRHSALPDLGFEVHSLLDATGVSAAEIDLASADPLLTTTSAHQD